MTLNQTREILRRANSNTGGWWSNASYTIEDARHRSGYNADEWDALTPMARAREIAYLRATDTMEAWNALPPDDRKRWIKWLLTKSE
jgi:hypothetical protein